MSDEYKIFSAYGADQKSIQILEARPALTTISALEARIRSLGEKKIYLDMSQVQYIDDTVLLALKRLRLSLQGEGRELVLTGLGPQLEARLTLGGYNRPVQAVPQREPVSFFTEVGEKTLHMLATWKKFVFFTGDVMYCMILVLFRPATLRYKETLLYMKRVGVDALPIVALISFLLGMVMAFMSAVQLQQFGANVYVASLVALAMARELGPIMTAIIVAGRSGSAFAAEIGSMIVSEEVSAMKTMGIQTTRFLVVPKLLATIAVMPLLVMFSNLFANFGGLVVGMATLDLTAHAYIDQALTTLDLFEVCWALSKSAIFAALIAFIGCFYGHQVRGGADAVGQATTSAVVSGIFSIIAADSVLAVILRYWS